MATQAEEVEKTAAERLFDASWDGDVAAVDALLWPRPPAPAATAAQLHEQHPYENEFGFPGTATPLFIAAWCGHEAIVRRLIAAGADVARGCREGFTPLMAAATMNRYDCAVALLDAGADVNYEANHTNNDRYRAIHVVLYGGFGRFSPEIVRLLLSRGADVDAVARESTNESTPLILAWRTSYPSNMTDPDARKRYFLNKHSVAFMLLRAGADVSHLFQERLHLATEEQPHPCRATQPLLCYLSTARHLEYVAAARAAGGFAAYANNRQCQLLTIKLLARGHGRLNLPEAMIPTIVSFWDKPWVPSFNSEGLPFCQVLDPM